MKLKPTYPGMRKQREEVLRKWNESGLFDNMKLPGGVTMAELLQSEAMTLLNLETFTLEENIRHYDFKYNEAVEYLFSPEAAKAALLKSMFYRIKKIKKDHCE